MPEPQTIPTPFDVAFDAPSHTYTLAGRTLPSVTQILKATGLSTDFDRLPPSVREAALAKREIGTLVHHATVLADRGVLEWGTLDAALFGYVEAWESYVRRRGFIPSHIETPLAHLSYGYAGTIDRFGTVGGVYVLPDIKTGDPADAAGQYQTALYVSLVAYAIGIIPAVIVRECVQLHSDGRYTIHPYDNFREDWKVCLAALTVFNAQRR